MKWVYPLLSVYGDMRKMLVMKNLKMKEMICWIKLVFYVIVQLVLLLFWELPYRLSYCLKLLGCILYQPCIFVFIYVILYSPIQKVEKMYLNSDELVGPYMIIMLIGMIMLTLVFNTLIELGYYICHKKRRYNIIFSIQKTFYNYSLIIISLIALFVAYDSSINASVNLELLELGVFLFLSMISIDLYDFFIHSPNKISDLYENILNKKKKLRL